MYTNRVHWYAFDLNGLLAEQHILAPSIYWKFSISVPSAHTHAQLGEPTKKFSIVQIHIYIILKVVVFESEQYRRSITVSNERAFYWHYCSDYCWQRGCLAAKHFRNFHHIMYSWIIKWTPQQIFRYFHKIRSHCWRTDARHKHFASR